MWVTPLGAWIGVEHSSATSKSFISFLRFLGLFIVRESPTRSIFQARYLKQAHLFPSCGKFPQLSHCLVLPCRPAPGEVARTPLKNKAHEMLGQEEPAPTLHPYLVLHPLNSKIWLESKSVFQITWQKWHQTTQCHSPFFRIPLSKSSLGILRPGDFFKSLKHVGQGP